MKRTHHGQMSHEPDPSGMLHEYEEALRAVRLTWLLARRAGLSDKERADASARWRWAIERSKIVGLSCEAIGRESACEEHVVTAPASPERA